MILPKSTILGHLKIFEIYEFYNIPVLFACKNKADHIYMAVWIDETADRDIWLYVSLSPQRFAHIRAGQISLHDAFTKPEDDVVLEVVVYKSVEQKSEVVVIPTEEMDQSWAPLPDDYLDVPNSLPRVLWEDLDQRNVASQDKLKMTVPQPWYQQLGLVWLVSEAQA